MDIQEENEGINGINVTPLVDITLVLLIIFMLTATLVVNQSIKVELPKSKTSDVQENQRIYITITKNLDFYLAGIKTAPDLILENIKRKYQNGGTQLQVIIKSDKMVAIEHIIKLMDGIRNTGVIKIGIEVEKPGK